MAGFGVQQSGAIAQHFQLLQTGWHAAPFAFAEWNRNLLNYDSIIWSTGMQQVSSVHCRMRNVSRRIPGNIALREPRIVANAGNTQGCGLLRLDASRLD